jgi:Calx-beta domain
MQKVSIIALPGSTVTEGTVAAKFQIQLDAPSTESVSVKYNVGSSYVKVPLATASLPDQIADPNEPTEPDYDGSGGFVTFAPGQTEMMVEVVILNDAIAELTEQFEVTLYSPEGAEIDRDKSAAIGYIVDNDGSVPMLAIADVEITEGDSGAQAAVFNVTLSQASTGHVSLFYALPGDEDLTVDAEWYATNRTVVFNPGELSKSITVPQAVIGNSLFDGQRVATSVRIKEVRNAAVENYEAEAVILDDDVIPVGINHFSINDVSVTEGTGGTTDAVFTVTLSGVASTRPLSVDYQLGRGTAMRFGDNADVEETSGTLVFATGETTKTVTVKVKGDTMIEGKETFSLLLTGSESQTMISDRMGIGTIVNDDFPPIVLPPVVNPQPPKDPKEPIGPVIIGSLEQIIKALDKGGKVVGTSGNDQIVSGKAKDILTGGEGSDKFVLSARKFPKSRGRNGLQQADQITDFTPGTDDIVLQRSKFPGLRRNFGFETVETVTAAQKSRAQITYIQGSGQLFFNRNGRGDGFGGNGINSGLFAILQNKPNLTVDDFIVER